jgi:hypothetical protein
MGSTQKDSGRDLEHTNGRRGNGAISLRCVQGVGISGNVCFSVELFE